MVKNQRHLSRKVAFQILYRYDLALHAEKTSPPTGAELESDLVRHFQHFEVPNEVQEFTQQLITGTLNQIKELDETIEKHAKNWRLDRMGFVDRTLLRMASHELLNFDDTPHAVIINEAVELAKQFGNAETASFVNGILDSIVKTLKT